MSATRGSRAKTVTSILYLHGFASSPNSEKVRKVSELLAPRGIELNAPDLNAPSFEELDFDAMVLRAIDAGAARPPAVVVGSSLGGLVALEVVRRGIRKPLVLIAPALGVADRWITRIPEGDPVEVYNHARLKNAPIHRAFFERIAQVDCDRDPPAVPVTVIMGRNDESVPFDRVQSVWQRWEASGALVEGSHFVEIPAGDHGLTAHVDVIADEIERAARQSSETQPRVARGNAPG